MSIATTHVQYKIDAKTLVRVTSNPDKIGMAFTTSTSVGRREGNWETIQYTCYAIILIPEIQTTTHTSPGTETHTTVCRRQRYSPSLSPMLMRLDGTAL